MPAENILQTLQKVASALHRLDLQKEEIRELREVVNTGFDKLGAQVADLRERMARLEAFREADRSQMQTDLARFKAEVERAEFRIARLLPARAESPALPDDENEDLP